MSHCKNNLAPYKNWIIFPINKKFYDLMCPLFLFYAYNCDLLMSEYLKSYSYLPVLGQEELKDMVRYLVFLEIIIPQADDLINFEFTFTVNKSIDEIVDAF